MQPHVEATCEELWVLSRSALYGEDRERDLEKIREIIGRMAMQVRQTALMDAEYYLSLLRKVCE